MYSEEISLKCSFQIYFNNVMVGRLKHVVHEVKLRKLDLLSLRGKMWGDLIEVESVRRHKSDPSAVPGGWIRDNSKN